MLMLRLIPESRHGANCALRASGNNGGQQDEQARGKTALVLDGRRSGRRQKDLAERRERSGCCSFQALAHMAKGRRK